MLNVDDSVSFWCYLDVLAIGSTASKICILVCPVLFFSGKLICLNLMVLYCNLIAAFCSIDSVIPLAEVMGYIEFRILVGSFSITCLVLGSGDLLYLLVMSIPCWTSDTGANCCDMLCFSKER